MGDRKTLWKGRRGRVVWHVYTPGGSCRFGLTRGAGRVQFSLRWVIGWVLW